MRDNNAVVNKRIVLKTENQEFSNQLKTIIKNSPHIEIVSETAEQIIVITTQVAKPFQELFPEIKSIKSHQNRFQTWKRLIKRNKTPKDSEIVNLSGVLIKRKK